jgi:hypothetical protein
MFVQTTSAAARRFRQPQALNKEILFALQFVPASEGRPGAGACAGGRSRTARST